MSGPDIPAESTRAVMAHEPQRPQLLRGRYVVDRCRGKPDQMGGDDPGAEGGSHWQMANVEERR